MGTVAVTRFGVAASSSTWAGAARCRLGIGANTRGLGNLPRSVVEHHDADGHSWPVRGLEAHRLAEFEAAITGPARTTGVGASCKIETVRSGERTDQQADTEDSRQTVGRWQALGVGDRCRRHDPRFLEFASHRSRKVYAHSTRA